MEPSTRTGSAGGRGRRAARAITGFTLIELLIVMTIIVVLAGTGLAMYSNSITKANEAALKQNLFLMREALDQYYADKSRFPPSLDSLVEEKYIRSIPKDPFTKSVDTWQTELSEPEPGNPSAELGIQDVSSGSDLTALDGSVYSEW